MFSYFKSYIFGENSKNLEISSQSPSKIITRQPKRTNNLISIHNPTNFYYLSLILEDDNSWSIHGLWPQYTINKYPKFCKDIEFNIHKLKPIINDLERVWYSNINTDDQFWKHEYLKHGTCNFNNFTELEYFQTTIKLYLKSLELKLPEQFYCEDTKKCLIPINNNLDFFIIDN